MIKIPLESYMGTYQNPYHAEIVIGKYTSIANGLHVIIASHPSIYHTVSNFPFYEKHKLDYPRCKVGGTVKIGNDVWIGENVKIVGELTIGDGAIIGAFSTVATDVPPYAIIVGNSGRIIKYRFEDSHIQRLLKIKWWDWPKEKVFEAVQYMKNIDEFLNQYWYE